MLEEESVAQTVAAAGRKRVVPTRYADEIAHVPKPRKSRKLSLELEEPILSDEDYWDSEDDELIYSSDFEEISKPAKTEKVKPKVISAYEADRIRKIEQNQAYLSQLGLSVAKMDLRKEVAKDPKVHKKQRKLDAFKRAMKAMKARVQIPDGPIRRSSRLKGEQPMSEKELEEMKKKIIEERKLAAAKRREEGLEARGNYASNLWRGRRVHFKLKAKVSDITYLTAPLTLGSIGTTIWSAGRIQTGAYEDRYWSNAGCLYRHRYPVGWKCSKEYFGREYHMEIQEGEKGPLFVITEGNDEDARVFKGPTPTAPWTEICIARAGSGTRVSGPLFFGFSDPISQRLIGSLETQHLQQEQQAATK